MLFKIVLTIIQPSVNVRMNTFKSLANWKLCIFNKLSSFVTDCTLHSRMSTSSSQRRIPDDSIIQEEFVHVGKVKTAVLKLGHFKDSPSPGNQKVLMLIIPGNPGVPYFYEDFMQELYSHCDFQIPVWILGHAGHVQPPGERLSLQDICSTSEQVYGLEAQIAHKVEFIQNHVPREVKLILIGHSIGSYMILNILDGLPSDQILRCFMLFPTIERMSSSPNGIKMTPVLRYMRWLVIFTAFIISLLPKYLHVHIFKWWYKNLDCPSCTLKAILATISPWTVNYTTYLAKLEMDKVTLLQDELIKKHADKLSLYYGANDHWVPPQYYYDLMKQFPHLDARLCTLNLKHAFVLDTQEGREMAKIVWLWAQSHHRTILFSQNDDDEGWVFDT